MPNHIVIDRIIALLVILESLHEKGYREGVRIGLLTQVVKNTSLIRFYPDYRELPATDPYKHINPWLDSIFSQDLPVLRGMELVEIGYDKDLKGRKHGWVKLTEKGRKMAKEVLGFPQYNKFRKEVFQLIDEMKTRSGFRTPAFYKNLKIRGKMSYETLIFDLTTTPRFPIEFGIEKGTVSIDLYLWVRSMKEMIEEKLRKKEIMRASHEETQLQFLERIREEFIACPVKEKPLVELCGLCTRVEAFQNSNYFNTELMLFFESDGKSIPVIARNVYLSKELEHHGLRVIGIPIFINGGIKIDAIKIYDRGKFFPTHEMAL
jgi:hypothetical protein